MLASAVVRPSGIDSAWSPGGVQHELRRIPATDGGQRDRKCDERRRHEPKVHAGIVAGTG